MSMSHEENLHYWCLLVLARHLRLGALTLDEFEQRLPSDGTTNPNARWYQELPPWMENAIEGLAHAAIECTASTPHWSHSRTTDLLQRIGAKLAVGDLPPETIATILHQPLKQLELHVFALEARTAVYRRRR